MDAGARLSSSGVAEERFRTKPEHSGLPPYCGFIVPLIHLSIAHVQVQLLELSSDAHPVFCRGFVWISSDTYSPFDIVQSHHWAYTTCGLYRISVELDMRATIFCMCRLGIIAPCVNNVA